MSEHELIRYRKLQRKARRKGLALHRDRRSIETLGGYQLVEAAPLVSFCDGRFFDSLDDAERELEAWPQAAGAPK